MVAKKNNPLIINKFLTTGGKKLNPLGRNCSKAILKYYLNFSANSSKVMEINIFFPDGD